MVYLVFYISFAFFAAAFLLGVAVQTGLLDTAEFRWLHHALFFGVAATAVAAVAFGVVSGEAYGWALLPVLGLYVIFPRVRAGTFGHGLLAVVALAFYALGFVLISL
ncbi:hypothetical protein [Rubrobacter indicoceani]|uniref:hypothetical protein n=1 Tax=Rubrobacter indicoceani TaxID=2051957 RepID=UPI000E5C3813|nr:hypothetical protein [Rubrobacter indicoceani]